MKYMRLFMCLIAVMLCCACSASNEDAQNTKPALPEGPQISADYNNQFEYIVREDGTAVITKIMFQRDHQKVPAMLDGYPVKEIGAGVFSDLKYMQTVEIENGIEVIGDSAFADCQAVYRVVLPDSLTTIGDYAFFSIGLGEDAKLPPSVVYIGDYAFSDCAIPFDLPPNLQHIGVKAFSSTSWGNRDIVIPESVTYIGEGAFQSSYFINSVTWTQSITELPASVFEKSMLARAVLPQGVQAIGNRAFAGCSDLVEIILPDTLTAIKDEAFINCSSLSATVLPVSLAEISQNAFGRVGQVMFWNGTYSFIVTPGSYGETFVKENGHAFTYAVE